MPFPCPLCFVGFRPPLKTKALCLQVRVTDKRVVTALSKLVVVPTNCAFLQIALLGRRGGGEVDSSKTTLQNASRRTKSERGLEGGSETTSTIGASLARFAPSGNLEQKFDSSTLCYSCPKRGYCLPLHFAERQRRRRYGSRTAQETRVCGGAGATTRKTDGRRFTSLPARSSRTGGPANPEGQAWPANRINQPGM